MSALTVPVSVGDHALGGKSAFYTLVEYGDLQCADTASVESELQEVMQELEDKLRVVYRHFPLSDTHSHAYLAAEAVEAAGAQGKFWEMRQLILENQDHLDRSSLVEYVKELKLDIERFERDLDSHAFAGKIDADIQSGMRSGVESTPTFFLNDTMLDPGQDLYEIIESIEETPEDESY